MPRKNKIQSAIDNLREALQNLPARQAVETRDKRSLKRSKKLVRELGKSFSDQELAGALEISRQKYTSLKWSIKKGKISSAVLNDILEQAGKKAKEQSGRPKDEQGFYEAIKPVDGKKKFKIDYIEVNQAYIEKHLPWAQSVKPGGFASLQSALNWYGKVTGGKEYFSIVKGTRGGYFIYDIRTAGERSRHGRVSGKLRAQRIMERNKL